MPKYVLLLIILAVLLAGGLFVRSKWASFTAPVPTPTEAPVVQLPPEKQPKVALKFTLDGHYVTVNMDNLYAAAVEYNLIYDAKVKNSRLQTGVNAAAKLDGQSTYSKEQLLGSESSGKFTYHADIQNAVMELTLRDSAGRSIFTATYPFTVSPGKTVELSPSS